MLCGMDAQRRRIDAPPLGIFTDANVLMSRADGAVLVVRASKTRYATVYKLLEQIPRERLLGVVLNRADEQPESVVPSALFHVSSPCWPGAPHRRDD